MHADDTLTDTVLTTVADRPGLTLAKIAKRLRAVADAGTVRSTIDWLADAGYLTRTGKGGRETYSRAA